MSVALLIGVRKDWSIPCNDGYSVALLLIKEVHPNLIIDTFTEGVKKPDNPNIREGPDPNKIVVKIGEDVPNISIAMSQIEDLLLNLGWVINTRLGGPSTIAARI